MNLKYLLSILNKPSLMSTVHLLRFFNNKTGVVIAGTLRGHFKVLIKTAKRVINVDNSEVYLGVSTDVDYLSDATNLSFAADESMDFVCSSHLLEHLANPLKAITDWKRVIKKGGIIYAGVPDKRYTFDHRRERTPLGHLIDDYKKEVDQTDETHISEFIEKWDEERDGCNREQFLENVKRKPESYMHHHVWITDDVKEIFNYTNLRIVYGPILRSATIHIVGQKPGDHKNKNLFSFSQNRRSGKR